jgi:hypothetical protein
MLIDEAIPEDRNVTQKEAEKILKYSIKTLQQKYNVCVM